MKLSVGARGHGPWGRHAPPGDTAPIAASAASRHLRPGSGVVSMEYGVTVGWLVTVARLEFHCDVDELGNRTRVQLFHDMRAMGLDGPLAGIERCGDLLVEPSDGDLREHLSLARGQRAEITAQLLLPAIV